MIKLSPSNTLISIPYTQVRPSLSLVTTYIYVVYCVHIIMLRYGYINITCHMCVTWNIYIHFKDSFPFCFTDGFNSWWYKKDHFFLTQVLIYSCYKWYQVVLTTQSHYKWAFVNVKWNQFQIDFNNISWFFQIPSTKIFEHILIAKIIFLKMLFIYNNLEPL